MDRAVANEAIDGRESEIWSCIFVVEPKRSEIRVGNRV